MPSIVETGGDPDASIDDQNMPSNATSNELPFLVTQWLANYNNEAGPSETRDRQSEDAVQQIHSAASEIASAFSALGAYGTASRPLLRQGPSYMPAAGRSEVPSNERNATFSDLARRWEAVSGNHLETVVEAGASNTIATYMAAGRETKSSCLVDTAYEAITKPRDSAGGRRLGNSSEEHRGEDVVLPVASLLQTPSLMATIPSTAESKKVKIPADSHQSEVPSYQHVTVPVESDYRRISRKAAECTRRLLSLRDKYREEEQEIKSLQRSVAVQEKTAKELVENRVRVLSSNMAPTSAVKANDCPQSPITRTAAAAASSNLLAELDEIKGREMNCERVIAQLKRKLLALVDSHGKRSGELRHATTEAESSYCDAMVHRLKYRDPFQFGEAASLPVPLASCGPQNNRFLMSITSRQYGGGGSWRQSLPTCRLFGRTPSIKAAAQSRKAIFSKRLSHAVTVNAHLSYPVYCLRFDRTGRYFVTGADDFLVKLFCLGPAQSCDVRRGDDGGRRLTCNYGANERGAVLVCTLRGHAGVICDIDVSIDNGLLATASDDGDCRIWGLRDGCPVAILRGHTGGANMVSWSVLTPYRLVTVGSDGLSRMWDVREAALKRYGAQLGRRMDYTLPLTEAEKNAEQQVEHPSEEVGRQVGNSHAGDAEIVLPPLPQRREESLPSVAVGEADSEGRPRDAETAIEVPLLPLGVPPIGEGLGVGHVEDASAANAQEIIEGSFVANDAIDEGVRLIAKLQHGDVVEGEQGPSTRSRRKAVRVICVARCPLGGHFATGTEDGLGRIWADEDDDRVERIDSRFYGGMGALGRKEPSWRQGTRKSTRVNSLRSHFGDANVPSTNRLLASLHGHINGITDLHYSHAGDRILTASQRDGVVRVWSWGNETAEHAVVSNASGVAAEGGKFSDLKHVLIRLTRPSAVTASSASGTHSSRRRGGTAASTGSSGSNAFCDVAAWTSDDSKIVTSQSCLVQATSTKIVPGSQFLLLWDSRTGQCLLGISEAHTMMCPVIIPHPSDPSILCTAGADGRVNVWNLDSGQRMFTHQNSVDHGPVEPPTDRGKKSGYLDGAFSPDGLRLVLTDDSGRITSLDALAEADSRSFVPGWQKEQYFANDYYELSYDTNGYCIERGSQAPPHLAPRAARCSHSGTPYQEEVNDAFASLIGPLPLSEQDCRWQRESIRTRAAKVRRIGGPLHHNVQEKRAVIMGEFDPSRTIVIDGVGGEVHGSYACLVESRGDQPSISHPEPSHANVNRGGSQSHVTAGSRQLSSNYRWRGYDDILLEEGNDDGGDTDDEEFVAPSREVSSPQDVLSDDFISDSSGAELEGEISSRRRSLRNWSRRPVQSSARSRRVTRRRRVRQRDVAYEERSRSQPTRVSARQQTLDTQRRVYHDPDSDEEIMEEFVSTENKPSGPNVEDYTVGGHLFRMPKSGVVRRKWLRRIDSRSSYRGIKNYAPQVGDSVVYIPRAHYETIQAFPTLDAPWKKWSRSSVWPVVRCSVRDVRYRFPYDAYYRNRNPDARCLSVVAILTLEVTGIPEISQDRGFSWPKPYFVSRQTRSSSLTFEVSMFESSHAEYVLPEQLYLWRLETLEEKISRHRSMEGLRVVVYMVDELSNLDSDPDMIPYTAKLIDKNEESEHGSDVRIRGSGYESLTAEWSPGNEDCLLSPWEATVKSNAYDVPSHPCMNETEKNAVVDILSSIEKRPDVQEWFFDPVDVNKYSDYLDRIEIPMDFGFIRSRVEADYYSNKLSILADVKLIRDNCIKYNGEGAELSQSAVDICEEFERKINKIEDKAPSPTRARRSESALSVRSLEASSSGEDMEEEPSQRQSQATAAMPDQSLFHGRRTRGSHSHLPGGGSGRGQRRVSNELEGISSLERLPPPHDADDMLSNSRRGHGSDEGRRVTRSRRNATGRADDMVLGRVTRSASTPTAHDSNSSTSQEGELDEKSEYEEDSLKEELSLNEEQMSQTDDSESEVSLDVVDDDQSLYEEEKAVSPSRRSSRLSVSHERMRPSRVAVRRSRANSSDGEGEVSGMGSPRRSPRNRKMQKQFRDGEFKEASFGFEEEKSCSSDYEVIPKRHKRRGSVKRRKGAARKRKPKKPRVTREEQLERKAPELSPWPTIEMGKITEVVDAVVARMEVSDVDKVFATPVAEEYPDADDYLQKIENPMDFRTIKEERIQRYESIAELQNDLILIFRNCTTYNGEGSYLWHYALTQWETINAVFFDVCRELKILLPRRWRP